MLAYHSAADFTEPPAKTSGRYAAFVSCYPQEQRLEWLWIKVAGRGGFAGDFDNLTGGIRLIEREVAQPQAEQLANVGQLGIFCPGRVHALNGVGLT